MRCSWLFLFSPHYVPRSTTKKLSSKPVLHNRAISAAQATVRPAARTTARLHSINRSTDQANMNESGRKKAEWGATGRPIRLANRTQVKNKWNLFKVAVELVIWSFLEKHSVTGWQLKTAANCSHFYWQATCWTQLIAQTEFLVLMVQLVQQQSETILGQPCVCFHFPEAKWCQFYW